MNINAVARYYDKLKPEERFRLVIEALARGDKQEADRLAAACPRKIYREIDAEYGERVRVSSEIVSAVILDLGPRLGKLRMIEAFREFLPCFSGAVWMWPRWRGLTVIRKGKMDAGDGTTRS